MQNSRVESAVTRSYCAGMHKHKSQSSMGHDIRATLVSLLHNCCHLLLWHYRYMYYGNKLDMPVDLLNVITSRSIESGGGEAMLMQ